MKSMMDELLNFITSSLFCVCLALQRTGLSSWTYWKDVRVHIPLNFFFNIMQEIRDETF